jgi:hypothetical protein
MKILLSGFAVFTTQQDLCHLRSRNQLSKSKLRSEIKERKFSVSRQQPLGYSGRRFVIARPSGRGNPRSFGRLLRSARNDILWSPVTEGLNSISGKYCDDYHTVLFMRNMTVQILTIRRADTRASPTKIAALPHPESIQPTNFTAKAPAPK